MQWLTDLIARLGNDGASVNVARSLAEEREAATQLDRFLLRFDHPAGAARIPVEPAAADAVQVA